MYKNSIALRLRATSNLGRTSAPCPAGGDRGRWDQQPSGFRVAWRLAERSFGSSAARLRSEGGPSAPHSPLPPPPSAGPRPSTAASGAPLAETGAPELLPGVHLRHGALGNTAGGGVERAAQLCCRRRYPGVSRDAPG
nr:PREDICTED: uncharacterized protein LOC107075395 [Lepisosteus oculatus]